MMDFNGNFIGMLSSWSWSSSTVVFQHTPPPLQLAKCLEDCGGNDTKD